jgi:hypothetical protein
LSGVLPVLPTETPFTGLETIEGAIVNDGPVVVGFTGKVPLFFLDVLGVGRYLVPSITTTASPLKSLLYTIHGSLLTLTRTWRQRHNPKLQPRRNIHRRTAPHELRPRNRLRDNRLRNRRRNR